MQSTGFAVIDLETTGFNAKGADRIIEIGVVLLDDAAKIRDEWTTLVHPGRDLGPTHVHGLFGRHMTGAPVFADISDELLDVLHGHTLVMHNAPFDARFLAAELTRVGALDEPALPVEALCTMALARHFLPGGGRTLTDCCRAFDLEIHGAHSALGDARATAELLAAYLGTDPSATVWRRARELGFDAATLPRRGVRAPVRPREAALAADGSAPAGGAESAAGAPVRPATPPMLLERLVAELPDEEGASFAEDAYLGLLDRCLEDHLLTVTEADDLARLADDGGIDAARRTQLHEHYFEAIVSAAWSDDILTSDELRELDQLAAVLEISETQLAEAKRPRSSGRRARSSVPTPSEPASDHQPDAVPTGAPASNPASVEDTIELAPGDQLVITGTLARPRDAWREIVVARGYVVHPAVTKKTRLLVAADPDSLSGKAKKARQYGIPIVSEQWLRRYFEA